VAHLAETGPHLVGALVEPESHAGDHHPLEPALEDRRERPPPHGEDKPQRIRRFDTGLFAQHVGGIGAHRAAHRWQAGREPDHEQAGRGQRVQARTAQLTAANQQLQVEMERRVRHQQDKEHLFDLTRQQSDQLRQLTTLLIQTQQNRQQILTRTLQQYVIPYINLLGDNLRLMQQLVTGDPAQAIDLLTNPLHSALTLLGHIQTALREAPLDTPAENQQALLNSPLLQLSAREREVLHLLVEGKSNTDIADLLIISAKTVSTHRANIMQKLGVNSLADLLRLASPQ